MGPAQPEIVLARQGGVPESLDGLLVRDKEIHDLLAAAEEMEGLRLTNGQIQAAAVSLVDREPLRVPERVLEP
jgi:hypothetical protein